MKNWIGPIVTVLVIIGLVFWIYKIGNPIEKTWARNYIEKNIADGWGVASIEKAISPNTPYYEVYIELYHLEAFHKNERYRLFDRLYFDKNGVLVRSDLNDNWKK